MACCHHTIEAPCIHKVPIFEQLTEDESASLLTVIHSHRYKKGEYVFREGEQSNCLFILNQGLVKLFKTSDEGKEQIYRFLFPGDFLGQFALLQEKNHYAHAEALEDTDICLIHRQDFIALLESNSKMAYRFLVALSERLGQAEEWIGTLSLLEVERRLAKLLLTFFDRNNRQPVIKLPAQKKELASLLGTTPETLSRKLAMFEDSGAIAVNRNHLTILNPELLHSYGG
jgi:CRP-like cAMP-binding protein